MKNSFLILGFLISLLISCPPPTPEPGPDGDGTKKEFTVSFDANGGTGTIAPMKVKAGTEITLPDGTAFTRKYYTFNYWTISGSGFYEAGNKYTVKADTVFSAAWSLNSVLITYDSNDDTVFDTEQWVYAGSDLILPGKNQFDSSPAGKSFYGWTTDAAATEADILAPGSAFRVEETDLTFYAYWGTEPVKEYKVTFFGTEMEAIAFNRYTEEIRLPLYTGEPGIICKGWDIDEAAANVVYKDGDIIPKEKLTGNIVLYPILEDIRVTLTWEKNGNVVSPDDSTAFPDRVAPGDFPFMAYAVTKDSGDGKVWILDSVTAKTASGKTVPTRKEMMDGLFEIWYISIPAEATVITLNWKEKTDVTVTSLTVVESYEYTEGDPAIDFQFIYQADFNPAKGNLKITKDKKEVEILSYHYEVYTAKEKIAFCPLSPAAGAGQYLLQIIVNGKVLKEASFNVTFTEGGDPTTPQTHTVTFNTDGGTGTVDPMTAEAGTAITLPSADGLSRQYYTFTAWETGEKQYNTGDEFTVNADTVFTAVWTRNTITVTYEANHESVTPPSHTETVDAGGFFPLLENPFGNSPDGQILYGWTTDAAATEANILAPGSSFPVGETALTFYAFWGTESVTEYTVTFSGTEMEQITFNKYTEEIRLPLYTGEPGIICKGWDTNPAAETVVYEDGGTIPETALTGNIVLYPILEDVRVALTWEKNGNVSPDNSDVFPDRVAPGDFLFMAYAVTKDSGDGKVWILESVTAKTVSGQTVSTRKEMMDGIAEVWYISVPAEATVITLNWEELTQLTVSTLTVYNPYEYYSNEKIISFEFRYSANSDPKTENLKITKDGKEVEILSYHYEFYTLEEKIGYCELSTAEGAGNYLLQIVHKDKVVKEAAFTVENKGERTFTPTAGTPTQNTNGQWVIPVSFVFSNISGPGWLDYNVFLNDTQEELTRDTDYTTTISDDYTNMDFTFTGNVPIRQGNKIRITFTHYRSSPIQTKSVEVTIP